MTFNPWLRKFVLTAHITASVGWIGAVLAYLVLDLTVATSDDVGQVRAAWIGMGLLTAWALIPLAVGAFTSGLVVSLGTKWGLFRHYWVVVSLLLTGFAVAVLLSEAQYIRVAAAIAQDADSSDASVLHLQSTLLHSIGGLVVLLVVQVLNIYKPRGVTRYGWRKQREESARATAGPAR